jgi:hypothetical protein
MSLALGRYFGFNAKPRIMQQKFSSIKDFLVRRANIVDTSDSWRAAIRTFASLNPSHSHLPAPGKARAQAWSEPHTNADLRAHTTRERVFAGHTCDKSGHGDARWKHAARQTELLLEPWKPKAHTFD